MNRANPAPSVWVMVCMPAKLNEEYDDPAAGCPRGSGSAPTPSTARVTGDTLRLPPFTRGGAAH